MFYHSCSNPSFRWKVLLYVCWRHGVVIRLSLKPDLNARNCWVLLEKTPSLGVINVRGLFINRWWNNNWDLSLTVHSRSIIISTARWDQRRSFVQNSHKTNKLSAATHCSWLATNELRTTAVAERRVREVLGRRGDTAACAGIIIERLYIYTSDCQTAGGLWWRSDRGLTEHIRI